MLQLVSQLSQLSQLSIHKILWLVSQLLCPLAKKRKKVASKCLPFKWGYIPLSLIELVSTNQFSCPSPLLPQYHLIYKTLSWGLKIIQKFLRKSEKTVWKCFQKTI